MVTDYNLSVMYIGMISGVNEALVIIGDMNKFEQIKLCMFDNIT